VDNTQEKIRGNQFLKRNSGGAKKLFTQDAGHLNGCPALLQFSASQPRRCQQHQPRFKRSDDSSPAEAAEFWVLLRFIISTANILSRNIAPSTKYKYITLPEHSSLRHDCKLKIYRRWLPLKTKQATIAGRP
jgi:hypothetical protein